MSLSVEHITNNPPEPQNGSTRLFVFVGGTSESGKSELTKTANERGDAHRVKYLRIANELSDELYGNNDPYSFLSSNHPLLDSHLALFWDRLGMLVESVPRITFIETIKHPQLLRSFGQTTLNATLLTVFVDADIELRIAREAKRLQVSPDSIRDLVLEKDALKRSVGLDEVRNMADIVVHNDGSHAEYVEWAHTFSAQLSDQFPASERGSAILFE